MGVAVPQDGTPNGDRVHRVDKPVLPGALSEEAILVEKLQKELRTVAALEVSRPHPPVQEVGLLGKHKACHRFHAAVLTCTAVSMPQTIPSGAAECLH